MLQLYAKRFEELSNQELYRLLKLRVDVFVVEQHCPYPELDDRDQQALHVWLADEDGIAACLRILPGGRHGAQATFGRVIAARRRCGLGSRIVSEAIRLAQEQFAAQAIYLEAQTYAVGLYEKQGFRRVGEEFLEDGIPHVGMLLTLPPVKV